MAYKIGDVVKLKSGGATMVVINVNMQAGPICAWHNPTPEGWEHKQQSYPNDALKEVNSEDEQHMAERLERARERVRVKQADTMTEG